jgi:hypothetical protein
MLLKLNKHNKTVRNYTPPYDVVRNFDDIDVKAPESEQVEGLLWIPAVLVGRFLGQFKFLVNEADEMFSVGVMRVVEIVAKRKHAGDKIGAVCNRQCIREIENYINNLDGIVKVSTSTRYNNLNDGKHTPCHFGMAFIKHTMKGITVDDHTEFYLNDAAEAYDLDLTNLTVSEKRKLADAMNLKN